jgi:hypothetical protein
MRIYFDGGKHRFLIIIIIEQSGSSASFVPSKFFLCSFIHMFCNLLIYLAICFFAFSQNVE